MGADACGPVSCTGFLPQEISPCCPTSSVRRNGGSQHEHSFGSTTGKGVQGITDSAAGVQLALASGVAYLQHTESC